MIRSNKILTWVLIINSVLIYSTAEALGYLFVPSRTTWLRRGQRRYTTTKITSIIWSTSRTITLDVWGRYTSKQRTWRTICNTGYIIIFNMVLRTRSRISCKICKMQITRRSWRTTWFPSIWWNIPWNQYVYFLLFGIRTIFRFRNLNIGLGVAFQGLGLVLTIFEGSISSTWLVLGIAEKGSSNFLWRILTIELSVSFWALNTGMPAIGMQITTYGSLSHLSQILCLPLKATYLIKTRSPMSRDASRTFKS